MPECSERMSRYSTSRWANHWGSQATTIRNRRTENSQDGPLSWSGRTERVGAIEAPPSTSAASANDTRLQIPRPLVSSSDLMHLQGFYVPDHPPHSQPLFYRHSSSLEHLLLDKSEHKSLLYFHTSALSPGPVVIIFASAHLPYYHAGIIQHTGLTLEAPA